MDRLANVDPDKYQIQRDLMSGNYPTGAKPCPGSRLQLDDDVVWLGCVPCRIVWGKDTDFEFMGFSPDMFGQDISVPLDVAYVGERAPADPNEEPYPIFEEEEEPPQQQFAQQPGVADAVKSKSKRKPKSFDKEEVKQVLTKLLSSLPPEVRKRARAYLKQHRSDIELPTEAG